MPYETDLAEIILQLGEDEPSHIVVPALHVNRSQVREIFARRMGLKDLSDDPQALTAAARNYLRKKFLTVPTAISGANFLVAETGAVAVVESEGNGRMCLTLPRTMITLAGIEKVLPRFQDLEVMLQVLARSATGERMNPYTSLWTGVTPGDGPQRFHVVLLDNGRSSMLARKTERQTLRCIRCAACLNTCPVYRPDGRPRVRLGVRRAHRRHSYPATDAHGARAVAALCVVALRSLLRGMPGQDQHSRGADRTARAGG